VDADHDVLRAGRDGPVDGVDIKVDQLVGIAARGLDLVPDGGVAKERNGDLVDLQVAAARRDKLAGSPRPNTATRSSEALGVG
jgi:hypothetical protein